MAEPVRAEPALDAMAPDAMAPGTPARLRALYLLPVALFLALALIFLVRLFAGDPTRVPSALIGRPAPDFVLPPLAGLAAGGAPVPGLSRNDVAPGPGGPVTIVNVFASWCGPCRLEHPVLMEFAKETGLKVVAVNYKDDPENARRFLGALGNPYAAVGADPGGRAAIDWGVYGVPETFVVDAGGIIRAKHVGPILPEHAAAFLDKVRDARRPAAP